MKIRNLFIVILFPLVFGSCDEIMESLDGKTRNEKFFDTIMNKEWTLDSLQVKYMDELEIVIYDSVFTEGTFKFVNIPSDYTGTPIKDGQRLMIYSYMDDGVLKKDTTTWDINSTANMETINLLNMYYRHQGEYSSEVIYTIKEASKKSFYLYRYEHLVNQANGAGAGFLQRKIKLKRN